MSSVMDGSVGHTLITDLDLKVSPAEKLKSALLMGHVPMSRHHHVLCNFFMFGGHHFVVSYLCTVQSHGAVPGTVVSKLGVRGKRLEKIYIPQSYYHGCVPCWSLLSCHLIITGSQRRCHHHSN